MFGDVSDQDFANGNPAADFVFQIGFVLGNYAVDPGSNRP